VHAARPTARTRAPLSAPARAPAEPVRRGGDGAARLLGAAEQRDDCKRQHGRCPLRVVELAEGPCVQLGQPVRHRTPDEGVHNVPALIEGQAALFALLECALPCEHVVYDAEGEGEDEVNACEYEDANVLVARDCAVAAEEEVCFAAVAVEDPYDLC